jgi:tetratricopeptide (TPR) repeat protein
MAINPSDPIPLSNKGLALLDLGKYEEAITYFDKALAIDPDNTLSKTGKLEALDKLGK